ncbi:MAG: hypothetical protein AB7P04_06730 [Bacteriovoracia bacterium]
MIRDSFVRLFWLALLVVVSGGPGLALGFDNAEDANELAAAKKSLNLVIAACNAIPNADQNYQFVAPCISKGIYLITSDHVNAVGLTAGFIKELSAIASACSAVPTPKDWYSYIAPCLTKGITAITSGQTLYDYAFVACEPFENTPQFAVPCVAKLIDDLGERGLKVTKRACMAGTDQYSQLACLKQALKDSI